MVNGTDGAVLQNREIVKISSYGGINNHFSRYGISRLD